MSPGIVGIKKCMIWFFFFFFSKEVIYGSVDAEVEDVGADSCRGAPSKDGPVDRMDHRPGQSNESIHICYRSAVEKCEQSSNTKPEWIAALLLLSKIVLLPTY